MWETWVWSLGWEDLLEKERQPTPVLLPGKSYGQRSLAGYRPWGHKELDTTEWLHSLTGPIYSQDYSTSWRIHKYQSCKERPEKELPSVSKVDCFDSMEPGIWTSKKSKIQAKLSEPEVYNCLNLWSSSQTSRQGLEVWILIWFCHEMVFLTLIRSYNYSELQYYFSLCRCWYLYHIKICIVKCTR